MKKNNLEIPAYVCSHVFEGSKPVLLVCKEDGDWQFLCGEEHDQEEIPRVIGINHILYKDASLNELMDLDDNWEAERCTIESKWIRRKCH